MIEVNVFPTLLMQHAIQINSNIYKEQPIYVKIVQETVKNVMENWLIQLQLNYTVEDATRDIIKRSMKE